MTTSRSQVIAAVQAALDAANALPSAAAPPPAAVAPVFHTQVLDWDPNPFLADGATANPSYKAIRNHTCLDLQWPRGSYVRTGDTSSALAAIFTAPAFNLRFGTTAAKFDYPTYAMERNGVEVVRVNVVAGTNVNAFVGNWPPIADAPAQLDIVAYDAGGNRVTSPIGTMGSFRVTFDLTGTAKDHPDVFAQTNSFDWMHPGNASWNAPRWVPPTYGWCQYPKTDLGDNPRLLPARASIPAFNTVILANGLHAIEVQTGPGSNDYLETREPVITDTGVMLTENKQPYFTEGFMTEQPHGPIIEGAYGVSRASHFTFLKFTERPAPSTKLLWGNNFAVGDWDADGTMHVWFGFSNTYAPYWNDVKRAIAAGVLHKSIRIHGNWGTIPVLERRARRPWNMEWDRATLALSPTDPKIGGESPHGTPEGVPLNPTGFVPDDHGFILRATFNGHDRSIEPTMDRFIPERAFGLAQYQGQLATSSRYTHRLALWNMQTGAHNVDVLSVPQAATVGSINAGEDNFVYAAGKTINDARALPMCFAEGIGIMDDWWYFFSIAQGQVRRVSLTTGAVQIVCDVPIYSVQSRFGNMAVSDGSFYPRHTVATATFDNQHAGRPMLWVPNAGDGSAAAFTGATQSAARTHALVYNWFNVESEDMTIASPSQGGIYPMSMAFGVNGLGAFACAGSERRVVIYVKRQAGDPVNTESVANAGHQDYRARCFQLYWNTLADSKVRTPLPRGTTANMDAWFNLLGKP